MACCQRGTHRILHVHRNVPGSSAEINRVFSDNQINVAAQSLQTNEAIGYVVIDIDAASSELALQKLQQVPHTPRSRAVLGISLLEVQLACRPAHSFPWAPLKYAAPEFPRPPGARPPQVLPE